MWTGLGSWCDRLFAIATRDHNNPMRRQCQFIVKQPVVSPKCAVRDAVNYLSWSSSSAAPPWRTKTTHGFRLQYIITATTPTKQANISGCEMVSIRICRTTPTTKTTMPKNNSENRDMTDKGIKNRDMTEVITTSMTIAQDQGNFLNPSASQGKPQVTRGLGAGPGSPQCGQVFALGETVLPQTLHGFILTSPESITTQ
jgi:hypothetical protein